MLNLALIFLSENILAIDGSFLFVFVSIILLIFILNATLFKPINKILEERDGLSGGTSHEAKRLLKEYEQKVNRYENGIRGARNEAYQMAENVRKDVLARRQEAVTAAKAEVTAQIESVKKEIAANAAAAQASLEKDARSMAASITSNLLHRPVNAPEGY